MFNNRIIRKAFQSVWRRDTISRGGRQHAGTIRKLGADLRARTLGSRVTLKHNPDIPTACWSVDGLHHLIQVGMSGWKDDDFLPKLKISERHCVDFVKLAIRHEAGHAMFSNEAGQSPKEVGPECKRVGVPFRLWNLFEDCYMENRVFLAEKKRFAWANYLNKCARTTKPSMMLLELKIREAASKSGWRCHLPIWSGSPDIEFEGKNWNVSDLVLYFFKTALKGDAFDRVRLAKRWLNVFGDETPYEYKDGSVGAPSGTASVGEPIKTAVRTGKPYKEDDSDGWRTGVPVSSASTLKRDRIARSLSSLIKRASYSRSQISNAGSRLNLKNAIHRMDGSFKSIKTIDGTRRILLIIDQSTSMHGHWKVQGGREFISAWKRVGELGLADVQIVYSSAYKRKDVSTRSADKILSDQPASGGEGLQRCCQEFRASILRADVAIIYTDGDITDGDIDLRPFRASTQLIGACLVDEGFEKSYAHKMARWFDSVALRNTAEALATQICRLITK